MFSKIRVYLVLPLSIIMLVLVGCSQQQPTVVYKTEVVEQLIPIRCDAKMPIAPKFVRQPSFFRDYKAYVIQLETRLSYCIGDGETK